MPQFFDGILFLSFCIAGLYFFRFWRDTRDRLFIMFALAFWIMAVNRVFQTWLFMTTDHATEHRTILYTIRLLSFSIILLAIIDKNRVTKRRGGTPARPGG